MSIKLLDTIYKLTDNSDKVDGYHFTDLCSNCPHHSVSSTDTSCWYKLITINVIATGWGDLFYEFEITGRSSGNWGRIRIWTITHNSNKLFGVEPKVTYDGTLGGKFKAYRYTVDNVDKFELWMSLGTWETWNFYVRTYEKETSYMALTWNKEKFTAAPTGFTKEITIGKQDIAGSASKLATARTISLTGSVTGSGTFDGSANLSIATTTNHTHNYAGSSSSGGAATSANKLSTARTISLTGAVTGSGSFDGSTNLSISTTVNHTHSYLPLSGGTVTGTLIIKRSPSVIQFLNASGTTFGYLGFSGDSTPCMYKSDGSTVYTLLTSNNYTSWAATKDHTHNYAGSSSAGGAAIRLDSKQIFPFDGTNSTYRKFATLNLTSRYTGYRSNIKVFLNQCTGNQGNSCDVYVRMYQQNAMGGVPAYRLETNCDDRYFKIYGVLNYSSSISTIDLYVYGSGSSYYSISATLISGDDVISIGSSNISELPSGTLIEPTKMGSVYSAGKLTTARTISLTGAVTGSSSFDGSGNLSIATTVNHTHNYAGSSSAGGAATSALKLTTARTISLTGSVTGSGTFDGSGNLSIATTTNHNHNSSYVTALGTSGNYLTWTKNGTTNNITIPYATYAGNADKLDNYDSSSFVTRSLRESISTSGTKPYAYVYLFRIANTTGYSTTRCDFEVKFRNNRMKFFIDIVTQQYPYGSSSGYGSSISIYKETKTGNSLSLYYIPTVASSGYNYYDVYCAVGSWQGGQFDLVSPGATGSLFYEIKKTYLDELPSGAIEVGDCYYNKANTASKLETARTISLTGAVTGSGSFNGSANLSIATTVNHTHNYAGSSSAGGAATSANKLTTARTISLTGSVTGSGSFDGSGNLSITTTTNHSHSYASKVTVGTTAYSVSSNNITIPAYPTVPTSLKCPNSLTIQGNGTSLGSYDGSAAKTINITYSNVGAAAASHTHNYVPISGKAFSQYNTGTYVKILEFTITSGSLTPSISFSWHPTECARDIWADFNINIRSNDISFKANWKGGSSRTLTCVGNGTTFSVWVTGTKTSWDPYGCCQVTNTYGINSYSAGTLQVTDTAPSGTYSKACTTSGYSASAGNADTVDGKHASDFAPASHTHSYAASSHTHTKSQITDFSHTHNYAGSSSAGGKANDSDKVDGYHISVGSSAGSDANTIYYIV